MFKRSEVEKNAIEYFNDSLTANVWLDKYALKINNDEFIESSPDDTIKRLAGELHRIEQKYPNPLSYTEIYELLAGYNKFVLGGSCLFGIGNNLTLSTLGNCFVVDSPVDSYGGIFKTDQELAQLMKRRGGVGVDLSTIRYKGSKVTNAAGSSTGIVTFAERFSNTTREVAQEGRRGALMLSLDIEHPDAEEFIACKDDLTKITGANISVRIPDSFMENIDSHKNSQIWSKLIHQAWKNGEPGVLFWDKIIKESPADCYEGFKTIGTNPCSELPLCAYDSCRLSAVNLFAYIKNPFTTKAHFSYREFVKDVTNMQRLMDNIIDLEEEKITDILNKIKNDPEDLDIKLPEFKTWSAIRVKLLRGRRTGLGLMGLADAIAAMGLKYGSNESINLSKEIVKALAMASYTSSIILAKERGAFLRWNRDIEKDNPFIKRIKEKLSSEQLALYNEFGRRNIANLTIAPTGSISMLARVSSGIEPVFALSYNRKRKVSADNPNKTIQDKVGDWWEEYTVFHPKFQQCSKESFNKSFEEVLLYGETVVKESPYYKATAHDIDPYTKLKLQSVIQPWIDHSISVTYNLPEETTEEQVAKLYYDAWKSGLKGLTVYREGSREGVLTTKKEVKFNKYDAPKRPKDLICDVHNIMAKGRPWKVFIGLLDGEPYEVFAVNGKIDRVPIDRGILRKVKQGRYDLISLTGETIVEDITHNMTQDEEAFTRTISWALRHGAKLEFGIEQLSKSEGDITSFSKAIARTLRKYVKDGTIRGIKCPNCGAIMVSEGGCPICKNCGTTKCD
jgi:ribonucleoside-diphosphate reductase alpha chain